MDYHAKEVKEIFKELKTSEKGLTQEQAKIRLAKTGLNEISKKKKTPKKKIQKKSNFFLS